MKEETKRIVRGVMLVACLGLPMFAGCDCGKAGSDVSDGVDKVADEVTGSRAIKQGDALKSQIDTLVEEQKEKASEALEEK